MEAIVSIISVWLYNYVSETVTLTTVKTQVDINQALKILHLKHHAYYYYYLTLTQQLTHLITGQPS